MPYDRQQAEEIRDAYLRDDSDCCVMFAALLFLAVVAFCALVDALTKLVQDQEAFSGIDR
jgi:hypothetical protein